MNKLIENGEEYEDNFPIVIDENGNFSYTYDKNVSDYKEKNNIPSNLNAKETFYYLIFFEVHHDSDFYLILLAFHLQ